MPYASREEENAAARKRYAANPKKKLDRNKAWRDTHAEHVRAHDKARKKNVEPELRARYARGTAKRRWNAIKKYRRESYGKRPNFRVACLLRNRLFRLVSGLNKKGSAVDDLGCSIAEFRAYIQAKFISGMTWDNHSQRGWHLDHIVPLASFDLTDREQFLKAVHFSNYQPLWWIDNLRKGDR